MIILKEKIEGTTNIFYLLVINKWSNSLNAERESLISL